MPRTLSPEHRAAISRANSGRPLSAEHRVAIGRGQIGRVQTPETIARITATKWVRHGVDVTGLNPRQLRELRRIVKKGADPVEALAAVKQGVQ
jgi:hypothetical protein